MGDAALTRAEKLGEELLQEAVGMSDVAEKKKALKKIADEFKATSIGGKAERELEKLK
jgi:hypothetical protein